MKTVAYLRVSTGSQNLDNQKLVILDYARQKQLAVDRFVEVQASSRKGPGPRRTDELLVSLTAGDPLIVSELSRLGRSLGQVIRIVDELMTRKIRFEGVQEQTKVMIALFGLFGEVERDLISERTKEGLADRRASLYPLAATRFRGGAGAGPHSSSLRETSSAHFHKQVT